jgi:hypothetical protein
MFSDRSTLAERAAALAERAEAGFPESWVPRDPARGHPQTIAGVFLGYDRGNSTYGPRDIAVVEQPDGHRWSVWLNGAVLQGEFREKAPAQGELIALSYLGRKLRKNPRPGENPESEAYRLVVDREGLATPATPPAGAVSSEPAPAVANGDVPVCAACGYRDGAHAEGCPESFGDVPF